MLKKNKNRTVENLAESIMINEANREQKLQQRLKETEDKKIAQMEKIEKKKQILLEKQIQKQQEKEILMQTKIALHEEQLTRKHTSVGINALNKSTSVYADKLSSVKTALDNNVLRLERETNGVKSVEQNKIMVDKEIERIELERKKELEENTAIQNSLLQKKQIIQTALNEVNDLNIKANTEYDKVLEDKSIRKFELEQAEIKLSLLKKFA